MKRLLTVFFLMVSIYGFGQIPSNYLNIRSRYNLIAVKNDSGFHVPGYSTIPNYRGGVWSGAGNIGVDTVNNKFYFYSGGAWREAGSTNYADSLRRVGLNVQMRKNGNWTSQFDLPDSNTGGNVIIVDTDKLDSLFTKIAIKAYGNSLTDAFSGITGWPYSLSKYTKAKVFRSAYPGMTSSQIYSLFAEDAGYISRQYGHIFAIGRNDVAQNLSTARSNVFTYLRRMVDTLSAYNNNRWVVLSILNGGGEGIGTALHDTIVAINNSLALAYPNNYVDVRSYLISKYNPAYSPDVTNFSQDVVPLSLRIDSVHLNYKGYAHWAYIIDSLAKNILIDTSYNSEFVTANQLAKLLSGKVRVIRAAEELSVGNSTGIFAPDSYKQPGSLYIGFNKSSSDTTLGSSVIFGGKETYRSATTAYRNSGIGDDIFFLTTTGNNNTVGGWRSGYGISTGSGNTGFGALALAAFGGLTGYNNSGFGNSALTAITAGHSNTSIGSSSLQSLSTGVSNFAGGAMSLVFNNGSNNSSTGAFSLYYYTGSGATSSGFQSSYSSTSGTDISTFGYQSNYSNQTGSRIAAFGTSSNFSSLTGNYNTSDIAFLGYRSGYKNRGSSQIFIGSNCVVDTITGNGNIAIGTNIELPNREASNQLTIGNVIYANGGFGTGKNIGAGFVGIKDSAATSTLSVGGSFATKIITTTTDLTLSDSHHTVIITGGTPVITLPSVATVIGREYRLVNQTGGAITISSYKDFSGADATTITANGSMVFKSNGTNWYRVQ